MSILTIDMCNDKVTDNDSTASEYDDQVLCAGWIPDLALQQSQEIQHQERIPEDLVTINADTFLKKMYSYQH